jgi:hypothetical protein
LSEKDRKTEDNRLLYFYAVFLAGLLVVTLDFGIAISAADVLILTLILVVVLSGRFGVINIPHVIELRRDVETLRKGQHRLDDRIEALFQNNLILQQTISHIQSQNININFDQRVEREAEAGRELLQASRKEEPKAHGDAPTQPAPQVQQIRSMFQQGHYLGAFATLRSAIERRLRAIESKRLSDEKGARAHSVRDMLDRAILAGLIDQNLADAAALVNRMASQIIHSEQTPSIAAMSSMIDLGISVLARLDELFPNAGSQRSGAS